MKINKLLFPLLFMTVIFFSCNDDEKTPELASELVGEYVSLNDTITVSIVEGNKVNLSNYGATTYLKSDIEGTITNKKGDGLGGFFWSTNNAKFSFSQGEVDPIRISIDQNSVKSFDIFEKI